LTTLANIRTKVRRLTASPSALQINDSDIDSYVNTFYLNDLPSHLKLFSLKETYTFYTEPNVDKYALNTNPSFTAVTPKAYYSIEPPVYIAGYESLYTQSRNEFFRLYPQVNNEQNSAGTGIAGPYTFSITNTPVLRNQVMISAVDGGGNTLVATDNGTGGFTGDVISGAIDYVTGAITNFTFTAVIPVTQNITVQSVPYVANRPSAVLFFDNTFTLRAVPDKAYRVEVDAYIYPTALLNSSDNPEAQFLWQLLAVGASKKIFEDRGDMESVNMIMPLFNEQMILSQRKTIEQNRPVRTATIYTSQYQGSGNLNYNNI